MRQRQLNGSSGCSPWPGVVIRPPTTISDLHEEVTPEQEGAPSPAVGHRSVDTAVSSDVLPFPRPRCAFPFGDLSRGIDGRGPECPYVARGGNIGEGNSQMAIFRVEGEATYSWIVLGEAAYSA